MRKINFPAVFASFLLIIIIFGYFSFNAPLMTDNYVFSLDLSPSYADFYSGKSVTSSPMTLSGAFRQACKMYFSWCGRFAGNLAVYLSFMLPSWLGHLLSTLGFGVYIFLLQICVFGKRWREHLTPGWILTISALVWIAIPSFGEAFFWLSVGGQFALLAQIIMLLPYRLALNPVETKNFSPSLTCILSLIFLLAGLITSSLDYSTSAALPVTALTTVIYIYFSRKKGERAVPWILLAGAIGLLAGGVLTLTAPGNGQRLLLTTDYSVVSWLALSWSEKIIFWLIHLPNIFILFPIPLLILAWSLITLWKAKGKNFYKNLPVAAFFFLLPFMLTIGAYLFTAWPPSRAFATCSIQLLLSALIVAVYARPLASPFLLRARDLFQLFLMLYCIITISWNAYIFYELHNVITAREKVIAASSPNSEVILPPLDISSNKYQPLKGALADLAQNPDYWVNRAMALYYGLKKVSLPQKTYYYAPVLSSQVYPQNQASKNGDPESLNISYEKDRFIVKAPASQNAKAPEYELYIYYYGQSAVLSYLWTPLANKLYPWLSEIKAGSPLMNLIPLLFARTDLKIMKETDFIWESPMVRVYNPDMIWLVKPGQGKFSFDLVPLKAIH